MYANNGTNVWIGYSIPRGPCGKKEGLWSTCACKRFMLDPLKALTSFLCDGCGHHSSYHDLENPVDDAVTKKWREQERAQAEDMEQVVEPSRKRQRPAQIPFIKGQQDNMQRAVITHLQNGTAGKERKASTPKAGSSKAPPNAPTGPSAAGSSKAPAPKPAVTRAKSKNEARGIFSENDDSPTEEMK